MYREEEKTPDTRYVLTDILTNIVHVATDRLNVDLVKHIGEIICPYQSGTIKVASAVPD